MPQTSRDPRVRTERRIVVARKAWTQATDAANQADPVETGGILLGYRYDTNRAIQVVGFAEVVDPAATATRFTLWQAAAKARLDEIRSHFPEGSPVGFVGEWHVHHRGLPPSSVDCRSTSQRARHYRRRSGRSSVALFSRTSSPSLSKGSTLSQA